VTRARRLGFRLDEIKDVVQMRRSGRCPCPHVLELVRGKLSELDRTLADLTELRRGLRELLESSRASRRGPAAICQHIRAPDAREGKEVSRMENVKITLCPAGCGACPDVEIAGEAVRIGEAGNLAVLKRDEWNLLIDLIQSGQLTKI